MQISLYLINLLLLHSTCNISNNLIYFLESFEIFFAILFVCSLLVFCLQVQEVLNQNVKLNYQKLISGMQLSFLLQYEYEYYANVAISSRFNLIMLVDVYK